MTASHQRPLVLAATALDFELDARERLELDRHLGSCPDCRHGAQRMREQAIGLRERRRAVAPARLGARVAATWEVPTRQRWTGEATRLLLVAGLALLLILTSVWVGAGARLMQPPSVPLPTPLAGLPQIGSATGFGIPVGSMEQGCQMVAESQCATDVLEAFDSIWVTTVDGVLRVDPSTGAVQATVDTGAYPVRMTATADHLFVSVSGTGELVRIDPKTSTVDGSMRSAAPGDLAMASGWLWVVDHAAKSVMQVDPVTVAMEAPVQLTFEPWSIASTSAGLWVTDRYGQHLIEINPDTAIVVRDLTVPGASPVNSLDYGAGVVTSGDTVWVASGSQLARYDLDADTFERIVLPEFASVAATDTSLWAVSPWTRVLERFDQSTLQQTGHQDVTLAAVPPGADWDTSIAVDNDAIWIWSYRGTLIRITPDPGS